MTAPRKLRLEIGRITVHATSGLAARRLADGLPRALERALGAVADGQQADLGGASDAAETAAARIAAIVDAHARGVA